MKNTTLLAASLAVGATGAFAGGIERSSQSVAPIFEDGAYVELSFGSVSPNVSGTQLVAAPPGAVGGDSGDMAGDYTQLGAAYKRDLSDKLSFALIFDQEVGADVDYPAGSSYTYAGSTATIDSNSLTAVARYKLSDRFSIHGGVRSTRSKGEVALFNGYTMSTTTETDWGYLLGAAYEIPDIALRLAVTYNSAITHDFTTTEATPGGPLQTSMETTLPQSVNIDFQTGIAADTLLMASARWVDWTAFDISPTAYIAAPSNPAHDPLVSYDDDTISYSLGLGRKFSDKLSGSVMFGYEASTGGFSGNLGPTDGKKSITVGAKYAINDQTAISGGVSYVWIGDAKTEAPSPYPAGTQFSDFSDNHAVGFGLKLSHHF